MLEIIKRIIKRRYYVVICPPSLYITREMTFNECNEFIKTMRDCGNTSTHIIVKDVFGNFTQKYVKRTYPIDWIVLKS